MGIEISVITKIEFKTEKDFKSYLKSDQQAIITGFANECKIAWETKQPFTFKTPRPEIGAITASHIVVQETEDK